MFHILLVHFIASLDLFCSDWHPHRHVDGWPFPLELNWGRLRDEPKVRATPSSKPKGLIAVAYKAAAQDYLGSLPWEHFIETTGQSRQGEITLESLALVRQRRSDVHVFNELLVQYPVAGQKRSGQVVPDNMVVITKKSIQAESSYNLPLEPARPFWGYSHG